MRPFDVVLFGATGFTGQLVAERLARYPDLRWAIAGRDPHKVRDVKMGLVGLDHACGHVGTLVADVRDPASIAELARSTRVLATTVGPYARYGAPVVKACVDEGTHYVDITGEPDFVAASRREHSEAARERGIKIVHCCGFDSIPADLGVYWTVQLLPGGPRTVEGYVKTSGRPSGGTWASFVEGVARADSDAGQGARCHSAPDEVGGYAMPLPVIDPAIVMQSAHLLPEAYGEGFAYAHFLRVRDRRRALRLVAGVAAIAGLARVPLGKRLLLSRIRSGDGPSEEVRAKSFFELTFVGEGGGERVVTRVAGGDPGYTETSRMLATCAWLLATGADSLPSRSGVLTPAAAFGDPLRQALQAQGITFETLSRA